MNLLSVFNVVFCFVFIPAVIHFYVCIPHPYNPLFDGATNLQQKANKGKRNKSRGAKGVQWLNQESVHELRHWMLGFFFSQASGQKEWGEKGKKLLKCATATKCSWSN